MAYAKKYPREGKSAMEIKSQEGLFLAFSFCVCMREARIEDEIQNQI